MALVKRTNALVEMHSQLLAEGISTSVDATMFTVEELTEVVRAVCQSRFDCKLRICKSQTLGRRATADIRADVTRPNRVLFA